MDILPLAKNSLNPEIIISRVIIIIAAITSKFLIVPFIISKRRAVETRILSAMGSNNSPSFDSSLNNLAKRPQGNDRAQIKSIISGECKIIIINDYYYGKLNYSDNDDHKKWASAVKIIFPNQSKNDRGAHINISGGGVVKHSKRKNEAIKFLEFLVSEEAQKLYANVNYEYPINDKFERPIKLKKLGNFREDKLYIEDIAILAPKAQEIIDTVYW